MKTSSVLQLLAACLVATATAAPVIEVARHKPCNIFDENADVAMSATLKGFPQATGQAVVVLTNYFNETKIFDFPVNTTPKADFPLELKFGQLEPGYYEIKITATMKDAEGKDVVVRSDLSSIGVVKTTNRTAAEARAEGSRFGVKLFQIGGPGIWWRRPLVWDAAEVVDACAIMGLQWTRHTFDQQPAPGTPGLIGTAELYTNHPMNVVLKVEGFPETCFDVERYGTIEEWKAKNPKKGWTRCTVPKKELYQKWLKEVISKIPPEQNIYEIGNEVWNYLTAEEFAEWCQMSEQAIHEARPDAKVGADPGGAIYRRKFLAAGGMKNMEIWFAHPYSFIPPPEYRTRAGIRNRRDVLRNRTGQEFELFVTEYGWPVAPNDKRQSSQTEKGQAQRTTRQSLMLYAEDAKVLIPHWMGGRDNDPTDREDWFGFFRVTQDPRPVVVAHAVCAQMIDGGTFVGDLPYGPGLGAMLFEKKGVYTIAFSTLDAEKKFEAKVDVPEVLVIDMMGRQKQTPAKAGKVALQLAAGDVLYVSGVNSALANAAIKPTEDLDPDVWSSRKDPLGMRWASQPPQIDGTLEDWTGFAATKLTNPKSNPADCQAEALLSWDENNLYVAVRVTDDNLAKKDTFTFDICSRPSRQVDPESSGIYEYQFSMSPGEEGATPTLNVNNDDFDKTLECLPSSDPSGIRWAIQRTSTGWTGEMAIPLKFFAGFPTAKAGSKVSTHMLLRDFDTGEKDSRTLSYGDENPRLWPYLTLEK